MGVGAKKEREKSTKIKKKERASILSQQKVM